MAACNCKHILQLPVCCRIPVQTQAPTSEMVYVIVSGTITFLILTAFFITLVVVFQRNIARKQQELFKAVLSSQENERERIGRDLHDDVGPLLSTVKLMLEGLKDKHGAENDFSEDVQHLGGILDQAITGVRTSSHNLTPSVLTNMGLLAAVKELINDINRSGMIKVEFESNNWPKNVELSASLNIYRVIQELLNNSIKHSEANTVKVKMLAIQNDITIEVSDDGKGFNLRGPARKGIGMKNIAGRVKILKGQTTVYSQSGMGTRTLIQLDASKLTPLYA